MSRGLGNDERMWHFVCWEKRSRNQPSPLHDSRYIYGISVEEKVAFKITILYCIHALRYMHILTARSNSTILGFVLPPISAMAISASGRNVSDLCGSIAKV